MTQTNKATRKTTNGATKSDDAVEIAKAVEVIMVQEIVHWPVDRLIPYIGNARTHTEEQVAQIAASIKEFGFTNPIQVDSQSGIIAGHCRLMAARKLGLKQVPVVILDHLSDVQRRALVLADNRLAESAGWDNEKLATEWARFEAEGYDVSVIGFTDEDVAGFMDGFNQEEDDSESSGGSGEDVIPEPPPNPVTRPGDIWLLGDVHFECPDCGKKYTPAEASAMEMECRCG